MIPRALTRHNQPQPSREARHPRSADRPDCVPASPCETQCPSPRTACQRRPRGTQCRPPRTLCRCHPMARSADCPEAVNDLEVPDPPEERASRPQRTRRVFASRIRPTQCTSNSRTQRIPMTADTTRSRTSSSTRTDDPSGRSSPDPDLARPGCRQRVSVLPASLSPARVSIHPHVSMPPASRRSLDHLIRCDVGNDCLIHEVCCR